MALKSGWKVARSVGSKRLSKLGEVKSRIMSSLLRALHGANPALPDTPIANRPRGSPSPRRGFITIWPVILPGQNPWCENSHSLSWKTVTVRATTSRGRTDPSSRCISRGAAAFRLEATSTCYTSFTFTVWVVPSSRETVITRSPSGSSLV